MGLLDKLDGLELSDEVKAEIRREHEAEVTTLTEENSQLRGRSKKESVNEEVEALGGMGFSEQPGLLKFVRRVYMSDDEEPAIVLLSDADLELSGDEALGAKDRQEMTAAGVLREFINLMSVNKETGKLELSDQVLASDDHERPEDEEDEDETKKAEKRKRAERLLGRPITRPGREPAGVGGGDS